MKLAKSIGAIICIVLCFVPSQRMDVVAQSLIPDEGLVEIVARFADDFEMLLELHEVLETLSVEERNSTGSTMMTTVQATQVVHQQVQALSEGRFFAREARARFDFNHALRTREGLSEFIHGQRNMPQSLLQIGSVGNGADHGCGPISVNNLLFSMYTANAISEAPCIADIIRRLDMSGGFIMGGEFGTNPEAILQLLQNMGHRANISYLPSALDAAIRQSAAGTAILLYIGQTAPGRPAYWHYITIRYVGDRFELYNVGGRDTTWRIASSVDGWAANRVVLALITIG